MTTTEIDRTLRLAAPVQAAADRISGEWDDRTRFLRRYSLADASRESVAAEFAAVGDGWRPPVLPAPHDCR